MAHAAAASPVPARPLMSSPGAVAVRRAVAIALALAALWGVWEAYRWTWIRLDLTWPFVVDETTMPHIHDIVGSLFEPSQTNGPLLIDLLFHHALFTAKEAGAGFFLGASI